MADIILINNICKTSICNRFSLLRFPTRHVHKPDPKAVNFCSPYVHTHVHVIF